ncbi:MAG: NAD(P)H-hydrate dehydratase [Candidatus Synoicihabitans palmerolidicus]|nr:NAD(P)H-hydrate dehydratase [Candidatus Synoicihabitans palmerolidicus]
MPGSHPILDCDAAARFERTRFGGEDALEWPAMILAGKAVGRGVVAELAVAGVTVQNRTRGRVLILVGKGHNGGDALLAASELLRKGSAWQMEVGFVFGQNRLRPLALKAWQTLQQAAGADRVRVVRRSEIGGEYLAVLDGVFGFQFRPPLDENVIAWFEAVGRVRVSLRAAVDLPSGLGEVGAFVADATYATGIVKTPLLGLSNAGRIRYLDLGFFDGTEDGQHRVLTAEVLQSGRALRPFQSDKRSFGHLAIVGGSRAYPGAVAMSVAAALQSGVGVVTAFVPESVAPAMAAKWPEAMWVGCPETPDGGIAMESGLLMRAKLVRATALLIGPGLGREAETLALVADLVREVRIPLVLDADALQRDLVELGESPRILTPHQGEFYCIVAGSSPSLEELDWKVPTVAVLKGPVTRIRGNGAVYHCFEGGPVLARGGSGDLLAGLIAGRLAAKPLDLLGAAAQGVFWHGRAAQLVAIRFGETAVRTTTLIDEINPALRTL